MKIPKVDDADGKTAEPRTREILRKNSEGAMTLGLISLRTIRQRGGPHDGAGIKVPQKLAVHL
ncbi:MAG TPA: hypothetical protein VHE58_05780 [Burkholderiales bacterium]|nr:hypothetical protein [Burkholderiales bacterium]